MTTDGEARLTSASSDAVLVRAARDGSAQAFTVLVERYHATVLR